MIIDKNYKDMTRLGNGDYVIDDINIDEDLIIDLDDRLIVKKSIKADSIKSNVSIKAEGCIIAGGYIEAEGCIIAGRYIKAGGYIKANRYIEAGEFIETNRYIEASSIQSGLYIKTGEHIKVELGIVAMLYIKATSYISAESRIFAGICGWREIGETEKLITCSELKSGEIGYGKLNIIEQRKEMTIEEIEEELGYKIRIKECEEE